WKEGAYGRRKEADIERDEDGEVAAEAEGDREPEQRPNDDGEDRCEAYEHDRHRLFVGGLGPLRRLDHLDHLVDEGLSWVRGHPDGDRVAHHSRAADH